MEREQASADMAAALDAFGKRPVAVAGGNLYAALRADLITDLPAGASADLLRSLWFLQRR